MAGRIKRSEEVRKMKLPRIGKVKTGFVDRGYPRSTDYFIPTGDYKKYFADSYGDKPSKIQIVFIDNDPSISCEEKYQLRDKAGKLFADGDGESFRVWNPKSKKYESFTVIDYPDLMDRVLKQCGNSLKGWEVTLTLRFVLPKIRTIAGFWEYSTKADLSSIPQIRNTFDHMLETSGNGSIIGIPFDLNVQFAKSNKPGIASRYPVVSMVANAGEENMNIMKEFMSGIKPANKELSQ